MPWQPVRAPGVPNVADKTPHAARAALGSEGAVGLKKDTADIVCSSHHPQIIFKLSEEAASAEPSSSASRP